MPSSGIPVEPGTKELVKESFKLSGPSGRTKQYDVIVLKFSKGFDSVVIDQKISYGRTGQDELDLELYKRKWQETVPKVASPNEPCWIVMDLEYADGKTPLKSKLVIVQWNPDNAPIKQKMLLSTTQGAVKAACDINNIIQIDDLDKMDYDKLCEIVVNMK